LPPNFGSVCARLRFCEPVPHDFVHVDHAFQVLVLQLTGQRCVLQARVSAVWEWALPPALGGVAERERSMEPPPHDLVHVDHERHAATLPSTAQTKSLHSRVSLRYGHEYPPLLACRVTARLRLCEPLPHDLEHGDQAENAETEQWTGQLVVPQERVWYADGHFLPP
jgi:hypothetical protein